MKTRPKPKTKPSNPRKTRGSTSVLSSQQIREAINEESSEAESDSAENTVDEESSEGIQEEADECSDESQESDNEEIHEVGFNFLP